MKIDIKINTNTAIAFSLLLVSLITFSIILVGNASEYYEYNKHMSDNEKSSIDFYYNCDSSFNSVMYNCPEKLQFKNITGYYCNETKICENSYKIK